MSDTQLTFPLTEDEFSAAVREIAEDVAPKIIREIHRYHDGDQQTLRNVVTNTIRARGSAMVEDATPTAEHKKWKRRRKQKEWARRKAA